MRRSLLALLLGALCVLVLLCSVQAQASSQTLQVPHELNEHELTDHYGDGKDPRFDSGEVDPATARQEGDRLQPPSAATGYYPPPPPPAPPSPPSAKHAEAKAAKAEAAKAETEVKA